MGGKADVVSIARSQIGVNWNNPDGERQILDYFLASTQMPFTREAALKISWCTYFVVWVLLKAGVEPPPPTGPFFSNNFSTARFFNNKTIVLPKGFAAVGGAYQGHSVGSYSPQAGDLYYKPIPNNHIGIIDSVQADGHLMLVNGNSFQEEHPEWMFSQKIIGNGCVAYNRSKSSSFRESQYAGMQFIEIPP